MYLSMCIESMLVSNKSIGKKQNINNNFILASLDSHSFKLKTHGTILFFKKSFKKVSKKVTYPMWLKCI